MSTNTEKPKHGLKITTRSADSFNLLDRILSAFKEDYIKKFSHCEGCGGTTIIAEGYYGEGGIMVPDCGRIVDVSIDAESKTCKINMAFTKPGDDLNVRIGFEFRCSSKIGRIYTSAATIKLEDLMQAVFPKEKEVSA